MLLRSLSANGNLPKRLPLGIRSAPRKRIDSTFIEKEFDEFIPVDDSVVTDVLDKFLEENDPQKRKELFKEYQKLSPSKRGGGKKRKNKTKKRLQKNMRKTFCRGR